MAKKTSRKGKSTSKTGNLMDFVVKPVLDVPDDVSSYYVNHAEVGHSMHEFSIAFGRLPVKLSPAQRQAVTQTAELHIDAIVQVIIPLTLMDPLIEALTTQRKKYEAGRLKLASASGSEKN